MFQNVKIIGSTLREVAQALTSPKVILKATREGLTSQKRLTQSGDMLERITSSHPDEKLAALGQAFEEMLEHPLTKKFRRNKITLYVTKNEKSSFELADAFQNMTISPVARGIKCIEIPEKVVEALDLKELKSILGHEIGHHLRLDLHPRRGLGIRVKTNTQSERLADQIGIVLAGEPAAAKSGLDKLVTMQKEGVEKILDYVSDKLQRPEARAVMDKIDNAVPTVVKKVTDRFVSNDNTLIGSVVDRANAVFQKRTRARLDKIDDMKSVTYPSLNERKRAIDELAQRLEEPEGQAHVQREIERKLERERDRLFFSSPSLIIYM